MTNILQDDTTILKSDASIHVTVGTPELENIPDITADPLSITTGVSWNHRHSGPPSCRCLICGELQYPNASIVNDGAAWLCEKCKSALKQVVDIVNG